MTLQCLFAILLGCRKDVFTAKCVLFGKLNIKCIYYMYIEQVAQLATIGHLRASIMFGDIIFYIFIVVPVACKNDTDSSKMKALECSQNFSHYKYIKFFQTFTGS